jgi:hypothetical protein
MAGPHLAGRLDYAFPARSGQNGTEPSGLAQIWLVSIFLGKSFNLFSDLQTCKFNRKIFINPDGMIQISMCSLFKYLCFGTGPMQNRSLCVQ